MKKGFTLAEALIALSLLGVVAALTVPNILYTGNDKKFIAQARKVATTMQDAIDLKYSLYGMPQKSINDDDTKQLLGWLTTDNDNQKSTLKAKYFSYNTVITSDGIIYAEGSTANRATNCFDNTSCIICADINGTGGPTTNYSAKDLPSVLKKISNASNNKNSKDVVCFNIKEGSIQTVQNANCASEGCKRFVKYVNEE